MTHYDPIVSVSVTRASGKQEELRRCGLMPHTFASYVGSIFEVSEVTQFLHNSHAAVRVANRTISARYLVADAWWPEWQSEGESVVQHDRTNPFAVGIDNLHISPMRGRGRPRGGTIQEELQALEVALTIGDFQIASEELDIPAIRLSQIMLLWMPAALLSMNNVPREIRNSTAYSNLAQRHGEKGAKTV